MKRVITLLAWFGLVLASATTAWADGWNAPDDGIHLGLGFSQESISRANSLSGGSYFNLQSSLSFNPGFAVNLSYATDMTPNNGSDQLVGIAAQFNVERERENYYYLALCYFTNLKRKEAGGYLGIKYAPFYSGRIGDINSKVEVSLFPVGMFYNFQAREYVLTFEMLKIGFFLN